MIPDILDDKYEVKREIASGAMGSVYLAYHRNLFREVAIKVPHKRFAMDPAFVERFLREARAMARMDHQNIIKVFDVLLLDNMPYIVMEYFHAENLKDRMYHDGVFSPDDTIAIGAQVANGLNYAHAMGIIHRDIKPANIMVDEKGTAKIADFGIAAAGGDAGLTSTGEVIGTPQYMSPEQARGHPLDFRTDIYSLGIVLYQMLTQKTPLDEISTVAMIGKLAYEEQELELIFPPQTPQALCEIIRTMVLKNRDQRPASTELLCQQLYSMLSRELRQNLSTIATPTDSDRTVIMDRGSGSRKKPGVVLEVPTMVSKDQPREQKSKTPLFIAGGAAAVVLVGVLLWALSGGGDKDQVTIVPPVQPKQAEPVIPAPVQAPVAKPQIPEADLQRQISEERRQQDEKLVQEEALKQQLNDKLRELASLKTQVLRTQNRADSDKVRRWAPDSLREATSTLSLADKLDAEVQSMVSRNLPDQALLVAGEALQEYKNASAGFENAIKEANNAAIITAEIRKSLEKVSQYHDEIKLVKSNADALNANQVSVKEYQQAEKLFSASKTQQNKAQSALEEIKLTIATDAAARAERDARQSLEQFRLAEVNAQKSLEKARKQPATQQDIAQVSETLKNFERAFESRNINALRNLTLGANDKLDFFQQLFSIYDILEISITDFAINSEKATAIASIERLVKKNGDMTLPASSWKNTRLEIDKTNIGWGKIRMP